MERAFDAQQASLAAPSEARDTMRAPGCTAKRRVSPTIKVPAAMGSGEVYKRTLVAELNRITPGFRLPTDRVEKMKVAAHAMKEVRGRYLNTHPLPLEPFIL